MPLLFSENTRAKHSHNLNAFKAFVVPFSPDKELYKAICNLFGFYPGNITLYKIALSHKSGPHHYFPGQNINNERLEYLGDAVLSSVIADYLYRLFPNQHEGFLTEMRSKLVSRSRLNRLAIKLGLDKLIYNGGNARSTSKSIYGDTFEAVIGAIYLDKGYAFTRKIILNRIVRIHLDILEIEKTETNFKSRILEYSQREKKNLEFKVIAEVGESYRKQYLVELLLDGEPISKGQDFSIKGAEQRAAEQACEKIFTEEE
jgi:ribonuclease III